MPYDSSRLETIGTNVTKYTIEPEETVNVLLGAAYFSGVADGTVVITTDGTYDVVPLDSSGLILSVNSAGTATL